MYYVSKQHRVEIPNTIRWSGAHLQEQKPNVLLLEQYHLRLYLQVLYFTLQSKPDLCVLI